MERVERDKVAWLSELRARVQRLPCYLPHSSCFLTYPHSVNQVHFIHYVSNLTRFIHFVSI